MRVTDKKRGQNLSARLLGIALLFFPCSSILIGSTATANARELAVIAGKSFPADSVTLGDVQRIYKGEKQILADTRLKPIDQRDKQLIKSEFLDKVLHLSPEVYLTYWNNRLFREGGIPPTLKDNSQEVIAAVENTDGAIGYVWLDEAKTAHNRIKILLTIDTVQLQQSSSLDFCNFRSCPHSPIALIITRFFRWPSNSA